MIDVFGASWREHVRPSLERLLGPAVFSPSPRERALAALLGATFAGYLALLSFDYAAAARDRAEAAMLSYETQRRDAAAARQDYGVLVQRQLDRARRHAYQDQTFAIAQIRAQADMETMLRQAGVQNPRVSADEALEGAGRLRLVNLTLEGAFDWPSFVAATEALSQSDKSISIESVSVDMRGAPRFRMRLSAPVMSNGEA